MIGAWINSHTLVNALSLSLSFVFFTLDDDDDNDDDRPEFFLAPFLVSCFDCDDDEEEDEEDNEEEEEEEELRKKGRKMRPRLLIEVSFPFGFLRGKIDMEERSSRER